MSAGVRPRLPIQHYLNVRHGVRSSKSIRLAPSLIMRTEHREKTAHSKKIAKRKLRLPSGVSVYRASEDIDGVALNCKRSLPHFFIPPNDCEKTNVTTKTHRLPIYVQCLLFRVTSTSARKTRTHCKKDSHVGAFATATEILGTVMFQQLTKLMK